MGTTHTNLSQLNGWEQAFSIESDSQRITTGFDQRVQVRVELTLLCAKFPSAINGVDASIDALLPPLALDSGREFAEPPSIFVRVVNLDFQFGPDIEVLVPVVAVNRVVGRYLVAAVGEEVFVHVLIVVSADQDGCVDRGVWVEGPVDGHEHLVAASGYHHAQPRCEQGVDDEDHQAPEAVAAGGTFVHIQVLGQLGCIGARTHAHAARVRQSIGRFAISTGEGVARCVCVPTGVRHGPLLTGLHHDCCILFLNFKNTIIIFFI